MNPITCQVCGATRDFSEKGEFFAEIERQLFRYIVNQCAACKSAFTCPMPSNGDLQRFYASNFNYIWYSDHLWAKRRDAKVRFSEYRHLLGNRVLDFGGGLGYFSQQARREGLESRTYDPFAGNAEDCGNELWDSVVALHVLEHSNDLDLTITQIKRFLRTGGKLILAVPNYVGEGYKNLGMRWVWAQPPLLHIFHFTPIGLKTLLSRHGFDQIKFSFHERWDANNHCDVRNARSTRLFDSFWGLQPMARWTAYRKIVAAFNSIRRFRGLSISRRDFDAANDRYSELQIACTLIVK